VFSYVDLVRVEIAMDVEERFDITIPDDEAVGWQTLGDVARSVAVRGGGRKAEKNAFDWARKLMKEAYGVSMELTPECDVFSDYDQVTAWFAARKRDR
jgi:hypothetical protein